ncbi:ATP-NAD kinase [Halomarina ordinaria]|uniref:ATP-NAD kinase n=1 Tax=Halomarina ordinaria TaxID=3033939 RepID=A0ABD5U7C6_9EURY|nr:ATP-NAD kinase [Halomarina sp. PSRA2]
MSEEAAADEPSGEATEGRPRVGVVGSDDAALVASVEAAGGEAIRAASVDERGFGADLDAVVAVGERALLSLAPTPPAPILPVAVDAPLGVAPGSAGAAVERVVAGTARTVDAPVVGVAHAGGETHALLDVTLVTASPARISEYSVESEGRTIARFRADGVVVATPLGSRGYARAAGAPELAPGSGVAAVAPISPFAIDPDRWVLPLGTLTLRVERDEAAVDLLADDRREGPVAPNDPVRIRPTGTLQVFVTEGRGLERH